jgi:uncharacterized protein
MKIEGSYDLHAPREMVWQHLMSPESLARALPGCQKLEPSSDGSYDVVLKIGIGSIKGTYHGRVQLTDVAAPDSFVMKVEGKGPGGFLSGQGKLALTANGQGGTTIRYLGEAQIGGLFAGVGQRLFQATERQIVSQFFQSLASQFPES